MKSIEDLFRYAATGVLDVFQQLPANEDIDRYRDEHENTLLSIAAQKGHTELVRLLIHKEARIDAENKDYKTPLFYAVENGDIDVLTVILTYDATMEPDYYDGMDIEDGTFSLFNWVKLCEIFEERLSDKV